VGDADIAKRLSHAAHCRGAEIRNGARAVLGEDVAFLQQHPQAKRRLRLAGACGLFEELQRARHVFRRLAIVEKQLAVFSAGAGISFVRGCLQFGEIGPAGSASARA
jgi:hypothetical protein